MSKDADYDAMIRHARATGLQIERCESVDTLPFLPHPHAASGSDRPAPGLDGRAQKILIRLRDGSKNRPARRTTLLRFIQSYLGSATSDADAAEVPTSWNGRDVWWFHRKALSLTGSR